MDNDPEEDKKKRKERAKARAAPTKKKAAKPKKDEEVPEKKLVYTTRNWAYINSLNTRQKHVGSLKTSISRA
jgi:hypothetical protein